jgi:hypothetical protein
MSMSKVKNCLTKLTNQSIGICTALLSGKKTIYRRLRELLSHKETVARLPIAVVNIIFEILRDSRGNSFRCQDKLRGMCVDRCSATARTYQSQLF